MSVAVAVGLFFVFVLLLPLLRHRLQTGEWAVVAHRAVEPLQRAMGQAFGLALAALALWSVALVWLGPEPLCVTSPPAWVSAIGWLTYALALLLVAVAQATMGPSWRIGIDERRTELVARGVYRAVRHPIYAGMMGLLLALLLLAPSPWTLLALPLVSVPMIVQAHLEEGHLESLHGDTFRAYAARTGRFWPKLRRTP